MFSLKLITCCRRHCLSASCAMTNRRCRFPPLRKSVRKRDPVALSRSRSGPRVRCWDAAGRQIRRCWCARLLSLKVKASLGIYATCVQENAERVVRARKIVLARSSDLLDCCEAERGPRWPMAIDRSKLAGMWSLWSRIFSMVLIKVKKLENPSRFALNFRSLFCHVSYIFARCCDSPGLASMSLSIALFITLIH